MLAEARADDERWFRALHGELVAAGLVNPAVSAEVFAGLPHAALVLAQGREQIGAERADLVRDSIVAGLIHTLAPAGSG